MLQRLAEKRSETYQVLRFLIKQQVRPIVVGEQPYLPAHCRAYFAERLAGARRYLEYGSGGSTVMAARLGKRTATVDSDRIFLNAVRNKIVSEIPEAASFVSFYPISIGLTREWGFPIFKEPTKRRVRSWRRYAADVWDLEFKTDHPDLVMVDGRFRTACALLSIDRLQGRDDWEILVDDFEGRSYDTITAFASLHRMIDRMAVFRPKAKLDRAALAQTISTSSMDPR
jgi:hypothetical protein